MKATEANFLQFLAGNNKQFIIPIYQRTYSWTFEQCKQLWDDIIRLTNHPEIPGHFIGSIVYIAKGIYAVTAIQPLLVIDGQQRLTTISLLLAAIGKVADEQGDHPNISSNRIRNFYLTNFQEVGELSHKLVLTQSDKETLINLVNGIPLPSNPSKRIIENFDYFERLIREKKPDLEMLFEGLGKLLIVDVSLDRSQDNPQLIFESLNSTGLELSQADLIRNYILMGQEPEIQTYLYQKYWYPMEKSFGHNEYIEYFDRFMRDYLTIKSEGKIPRISEVYKEFKIFAPIKNHVSIEPTVKDIFAYSKYFVSLAFEQSTDSEISNAISNINILKVEVVYPFLMEVYKDLNEQIISKCDFIEVLQMVESYVFRRVICGIPTNSLNKTFASLYREINKEKYMESLKAALLNKDSYRRFPTDDEFKREFVIKDVYNFRNRNYLLRKLENFSRQIELVNVENYTIEHIMPQNEELSSAWKNELGLDWKQVQERYLHTIGNLTLTGYNSEYSDRSFIEKRDYVDNKGFRNSPLNLNQGLSSLEHWNKDTICARAENLSQIALQIWKRPELSEEILVKYRKTRSNEDDFQYDIQHFEYLQGNMLELFHLLEKRVMNLDSSVRMEFKKLYIAFKATTNFVDIVPQKNRLRLSLNMPFEKINDEKGICKNVSGLGRWGNGEVEVGIDSITQIDDIMKLIVQAYRYQTED